MTDRTNLDVAAEAMSAAYRVTPFHVTDDVIARAALDAIHPALAHLTPADVDRIIRGFMRVYRGTALEGKLIEVLSRD